MDNRTGVLITAVGGSGSTELVKSLHDTGDYRIIALDASTYAAAYQYADARYTVPMSADPGYEDAVRAIVRRERPEFIVPCVDEEILLFHRIAAEECGGRIRVLAPVAAFCELAMDKWAATRGMRDAGIPAPRTWLAGDAEGCVYPAIIKPRVGRGSRGLAFLESAGDLAAYLAEASEPADRYIVQERIFGREFTVSVVVALGGPELAVVPKEVVIKKGITHVGVTRVVPVIERMCRDIQQRMRADGPFNVQLILAEDGVPYVIEINPRYSTTVALTIGAGINEVDVVMRRALGKPVEKLEFTPDLMMLRHYTALYVHEAEWGVDDAS